MQELGTAPSCSSGFKYWMVKLAQVVLARVLDGRESISCQSAGLRQLLPFSPLGERGYLSIIDHFALSTPFLR